MAVATCFFCGKVLGSIKKLEDHCVAEHGAKRFNYKCKHPGCTAQFVTEEQLSRHGVSHCVGT